MKRIFTFIGIAVIICSLFGCATIRSSLTPKDIKETENAIEKARLSGAEKRCPKEYQGVMDSWNKALEMYKTCQCMRKGVEKMSDIRERANRLCTDSDGDGVPDEMDKCPNTPKGVEVDEHGCPFGTVPKDSDGDGVLDHLDKCPDTPKGVKVDKDGCPPAPVVIAPQDSDGDGVTDDIDKCPDTPKGVKVDKNGCPLDSDGDGVPDYLDKCPDTPKGVKVDKDGCPPAPAPAPAPAPVVITPKDSDGDGVTDDIDKCPNTPKGVKVDSQGCPIDTDGDGVADYLDKCPDTPKGAAVNEVGCWVLKNVNFDFDKSDIKPQFHPFLDDAAGVLKKNPTLKVEIQGHTDATGDREYNQALSEKRATAVMEYFSNKGIEKGRMTAKGFGFSQPVDSNKTKEGRAKNRRVELKPIH